MQSLRALAEKASTTLTHAPNNGARNIHRMEDVIMKMTELDNEINVDIDKLVVLKADIISAIKGLSKPNHRIVLELRYLTYKTWSEIAAIMCYNKDYIFTIHKLALREIVLPE